MLKNYIDRFFFRRYFEQKEDYEEAVTLMARDSVKTGMTAVRAITVFEVLMILFWFISGNDFTDPYSMMYFLSYIFLLVVSIGIYVLLADAVRSGKNLEKKAVFSIFFYNIMLLSWALLITWLDISKSGYFSCLVYMTIIVIIPVATFIEPFYYLLLNACGSVTVMTFLFIYCDRDFNRGNIINFTVFALISMIAGCAYSKVRISSYVNRVKLERANETMQYASEHDFLSGLYNRQKLGILSEQIWKQCMEKGEKLSCVLCDLDNFKKFNDVYGHDCGDACIRLVADIFREVLSDKGACYFRYGGEEFLVLFPEKGYAYCYAAMKEIQDRLRASKLEHAEGCTVTMSVGIYTGMPNQELNITQYFTRADSYMYEAKLSGKDCIQGFDEYGDA